MQALENFAYEKLASDVILNEQGDLTLAVSLLGANPEVQNGRSIQYNLNIEQNLFDLLRSLRLADRVSSQVGDKVLD